MIFERNILPSFMRMKHLKQAEKDGSLHYIKEENAVVGFYEINELNQFKNLFILPQYRRNGYARKVITKEMEKRHITIATTKRLCPIKKLIIKLGFTFTGQVAQGKQSPLEIWKSPKIM